MSVSSLEVTQATYAATLVDEWIRCGLREVVICPGSRSTPLALAFADRDELTVHVRIDERSAGFFALGCSKRSALPVVILVTSGSAAAEVHPSVVEASTGDVPLLVVTADRPSELHGVGASQTVRQRELYGPLVRRFEEPGVARLEARDSWRPLASRLYEWALAFPRGPVHLNAAFVEPLVGQPAALDNADLTSAHHHHPPVSSLVHIEVNASRVMVIAGAGASARALSSARQHGWIVAGDATCVGALAHVDVILRDDDVARALRPDAIIRLGGLPASKILAQRLVQWRCDTIALSDALDVADPDGHVRTTYVVHGADVAFDAPPADAQFIQLWRHAEGVVAEVAAQLDDDATPVSEPSVARCVVELAADLDAPLVVGSSMPIRDVEWWARARRGVVHANRGVNGIDGVTSTLLGVAAGARGIGLLGDVTYLHDVSALTDGLGTGGGSCAVVVLDNGGGGIFGFLPQATALEEIQFDQLFATSRRHDLSAIATAFGHDSVAVSTNGELRSAVVNALSHPGVTVVVAAVPHYSDNVILHDELNALSASLLRERLL